MGEEIELPKQNIVLGVDWSSGEDVGVVTQIRRNEGGTFSLLNRWMIVKQLTQEEVNELPDGSKILVLWTGGNGPHEYEKKSFGNLNPWVGSSAMPLFLDFVGPNPITDTLVWLLVEM